MSQRALLLVNLGTPASTDVADVRRYLREFLGDPDVISLPAPLRFLLLEGIILRTRLYIVLYCRYRFLNMRPILLSRSTYPSSRFFNIIICR